MFQNQLPPLINHLSIITVRILYEKEKNEKKEKKNINYIKYHENKKQIKYYIIITSYYVIDFAYFIFEINKNVKQKRAGGGEGRKKVN